jgi:4-amino-4-deoxy-L-arabinose transferase-like glycosyltransferase
MINISKHKLLLLIGITVLVFILMLLIDFNGLYGQDSHEYLRYTKHLKSSLVNLRIPDNYFWPVMYPLIGSILSLSSIPEAYILQFISIFAYVVTAIYIIKTLEILYKRSSLIYVIIFFLLSPMVFRLGSEIMSDMLCLSVLTTGFYHLLKYDSLKKFNNLLYSVFLFSLAFHSRYVSILIF